jgi:hypothetical protein
MSGIVNIDKVPDTLYHYCGVNGFHGIFSSKQLWLSNVSFMNDYMEHRWLIEKARDRIDDLSCDSDNAEPYISIDNFLSSSNFPYIFSLSSKGDLLSQWRAYSDDGAGFAVGFSSKYFLEQFETLKGNRFSLRLSEVEYDENKQLEFINQCIQSYMDQIDNTEPIDEEILAYDAASNIENFAAVCKNSGFIEEGEWRIVLIPSMTGWTPGGNVPMLPALYNLATSEISFRVGGNRVIPFFKFSFTPDAITEIYLGPKNYARENNYPLLLFLQNQGFNLGKIKINNSAATYR